MVGGIRDCGSDVYEKNQAREVMTAALPPFRMRALWVEMWGTSPY